MSNEGDQAGLHRLSGFRQEFPARYPLEWTILAENQWTLIGRKLIVLG